MARYCPKYLVHIRGILRGRIRQPGLSLPGRQAMPAVVAGQQVPDCCEGFASQDVRSEPRV